MLLWDTWWEKHQEQPVIARIERDKQLNFFYTINLQNNRHIAFVVNLMD